MVKPLFMSDGSINESRQDRRGTHSASFCWEPCSTDPELSQLKTLNKRLWMTDGSREEAEGKGWSGKIPAGTREGKASQVPPKSGILCRGWVQIRHSMKRSSVSDCLGLSHLGC